METVFTILTGIGLRIILPVGITVLAILLLRRLDRRWQKDALKLPVISTASKPCWEIQGCSEDWKKNCPAFARPGVPCWQVFRLKDGVLKESCLSCNVFRQAPLPESS